MAFFSRRKKKDNHRPALLRGSVTVGARTWTVTEERRQGPRPQVFVLRAEDDERSQMHIRPLPGQPLSSIEDVQRHAEEPELRWIHGEDGLWEARLVISEDPAAPRIKFVSWTAGVFEGAFPPETRLGIMSDGDLLALLDALRRHHAPEES